VIKYLIPLDEAVRIDKWLWAVRVFKTRNQAGIACHAGKVRINGHPVKPSHEVKLHEIIMVNVGPLTKSFQVTGIIKNRVSAKLAVDFVKDVTPEEEYEQLRLKKEMNFEIRDRGTGRPTKKERRQIVRLKRNKL
jgi:ribosome-associated heat shock protein Hsp15